jgi:hypothetical protein
MIGKTGPTNYAERYEEGRRVHAQADSGTRRYDICMALNMTKLSIECERLERLGVSPRVIRRWEERGMYLLEEILEVSDPLKSGE